MRRDTHRGLGEVEASFTPSDPTELRPVERLPGDSFEFQFPSDAKVPKIPDDGRAVDDMASSGDQEKPDRRRFDTATGGGTNRVSGGRDVARAYVAPMTPAPVHLRTQDTISVEVSESFNQFDTIPSLNRRRLAEHLGTRPPMPQKRPLPRVIWIAALAIVFGIGMGLLGRAMSETREPIEAQMPPPAVPPRSTSVVTTEPRSSASAAPAVSDAAPVAPRGVQGAEAAAVDAEPAAAVDSSAAPTTQPATSPAADAPTRTPGPKPAKKSSGSKSRELWLE